ncbi:leucine--tRNA ligase [candidate division SR1 bacterium]|nr:leucine--tRNA ligase [candidate division SR1 bacterium]
MQINLNEIEKKWQAKRNSEQVYKTTENSDKKPFYVLDMFPYPSGAGLHVGHPKGYVASDTLARKKMLEGFSVLHPMGFDTFGLGTEQYAIDNKMKPQDVAAKNIAYYKEQLEKIGFSYDWDRSFSTADPDYFRRTQWVFLQLYTHYYDEEKRQARPIEILEERLKTLGLSEEEIKSRIDNERLAYIDYKPINRCPHCKTGLANEDLEDGKCERCGNEVEQRPMRQWVLRITKYADRLIEGLDGLNWNESMKELERNWIGKSSGTQFRMDASGRDRACPCPNGEAVLSFDVFTTRIDTVFGMSFVVMAPEHALVDQITTDEYRDAVVKYKEQAKHKTQLERTELQKEKTGQFTGAYAINPFNGEEVPIYIGDYVLANYGTGVVMAVPAHDERDFAFAKKYGIKITQSIAPLFGSFADVQDDQTISCFTEKGVLVNSGDFTGLTSDDAIKAMQKWLKESGIGGEKNNYKIQDWVFSRQRYRGEPFPMVFCPEHGTVPLNESDLPLLLPEVENYEPTGTEEGPLADIQEWINTTCPICGKAAKRESNTMPGRAGSSRYWLRYMDPKNADALVSENAEKYRGNVDVYVGGAEHITRHMIYARFWQKFLFDIGVVSQEEPFQRYEKVGLIMAEDGRKMSKRRGNTVNPDDVIAEYGADAFRVYEMFMGPFDQYISWNTNGLKGVKKFLDKVIALWEKVESDISTPPDVETLLHKTIKKTTEDIDAFRFNTTISQFMILVNRLTELDNINREVFQTFITLLAPFAPHLSEEFWSLLGNEFSIFKNAQRPQRDEKKLASDMVKLAIQFNGKVRGTVEVSPSANQDEVMALIKGDEKLNGYLSSGEVRKVIYVSGKIMNVVVG